MCKGDGRGGQGRGLWGNGGGSEALDVNVDLLAGLAMAGNTAEEKVMASGLNGDGVVAGRVCLYGV